MKRNGFLFLALTGALLSACAPQNTPDATKPSVSLAATPTTITAVGKVSLEATATDNVGVTKVDFYQGTTLVSTDTTKPYTATTADLTAAQNGTITYRAVASDAAGNTAEATTNVIVNIDVTAPTISLTASATTVNAPQTVTFTAAASDNIGVTKVEFYDNGTLISTATNVPYTTTRTYTFTDNGVHTITAKAYDAMGNVKVATTTITVAIADANEPNDSVAAATPIGFGSVNGVITAQGRDMDYFKFDAAAGDMLKLTVQSISADPTSTLDPYVMILMPDGKTILEKDDDSGAGLESEIRFNVPANGRYTIVVTSFNIHDDSTATDNKTTNTYRLTLSRR